MNSAERTCFYGMGENDSVFTRDNAGPSKENSTVAEATNQSDYERLMLASLNRGSRFSKYAATDSIWL